MFTFTRLTLSIECLFDIAVIASWASPDEAVRHEFLLRFANQLANEYGIERSLLTAAGFPEEEPS